MRRQRAATRTQRWAIGLAVAVAALSMLPAAAVPQALVVAASATTVDVSPEHGAGPTGGTVTLTAVVYDEDGNVFAGPGTSTQVRFYFDPTSPNDVDSPGNSSDLRCVTGETGT